MSGAVAVRGPLSGDWGRPLREMTLEPRVDRSSALEDAAAGRASEAGAGSGRCCSAQALSWEGSTGGQRARGPGREQGDGVRGATPGTSPPPPPRPSLPWHGAELSKAPSCRGSLDSPEAFREDSPGPRSSALPHRGC